MRHLLRLGSIVRYMKSFVFSTDVTRYGNLLCSQASLYQPIHKLVSRLCVLVHADNPSKYELFVEGAVLGQTKDPEMSSEVNLSGRNVHVCVCVCRPETSADNICGERVVTVCA